MKKLFSIVLFALIFFSGCYVGVDNPFLYKNSVHGRANNLKILDEESIKNLQSKYSFVVITDVHVGSIKKDSPDLPDAEFLKWLSDFSEVERPKFCLCLGDVADTGTKEQFKDYAEFVKKIEALGVKVFNSVGNHDLYQSGWSDWEENCYPNTSFYTFKTSKFSFYSLDTGTCNYGPTQLQAFKSAIAKDSRPKIVFTHYPLYTKTFFFNEEDTTERNLMMSYCAKNNVKLYLAGHLHWYEEVDFGKYQAYVIPSYRYKGQWALVTVNEAEGNYKLDIITK